MLPSDGAIVPPVADDPLAQSATGPLVFLEKFLALLDSGRFTATYKFATLAALIDVCGESVGGDGRPAEQVSARRVGGRVLELLWLHSVPYSATAEGRRYLRHSTQQGDLVSKVTALGRSATLARASLQKKPANGSQPS
jgi:hypothetical protein